MPIGASLTTAATPWRLNWPMRSSRSVTGASPTVPLAVSALPVKRSCAGRMPRRAASAGARTTCEAPVSTRKSTGVPLTMASTT